VGSLVCLHRACRRRRRDSRHRRRGSHRRRRDSPAAHAAATPAGIAVAEAVVLLLAFEVDGVDGHVGAVGGINGVVEVSLLPRSAPSEKTTSALRPSLGFISSWQAR
jgi:hypothetical protein